MLWRNIKKMSKWYHLAVSLFLVWFISQVHKFLVTLMASKEVPLIDKGWMQLPIPVFHYCFQHCRISLYLEYTGLPRWLSGEEATCQSLGREDPLEGKQHRTPVFLPGEFHGQRSLAGYSPWGHRESDTTEQLSTAQHKTLRQQNAHISNELV